MIPDFKVGGWVEAKIDDHWKLVRILAVEKDGLVIGLEDDSPFKVTEVREPQRGRIKKGSVVLYKDGHSHYRVRSINSKTVNLCTVFGGKMRHKGVPLTDVIEDEAAWYAAWQKSETYQCM